MITTAELHRQATAQGLRFEQVEKDYLILLVLAALGRRLKQSQGWHFKGGTCLRHCYYAGYRFSDDIDFTCVGGEGTPDEGVRFLGEVAREITSERGVQARALPPRFDPVHGQTELAVEYLRTGARQSAWPQVKIHLSFDEPLLDRPELRTVTPPYSEPEPFALLSYSLLEIVSEKLRALIQQQARFPRPRDLYDLWYITCLKREPLDRQRLRAAFEAKCLARKVDPDLAMLTSETLRTTSLATWRSLIVPVVRIAPEFEMVWSDWVTRIGELL